MTSRLVNRNVLVDGRRTSMRLEPEFWAALKRESDARRLPIARIVTEAVANYPGSPATSAVRVFLLQSAVSGFNVANLGAPGDADHRVNAGGMTTQ